MYKLAFSLFSTDPRNMRWFNWKRLLVILIMLPLFMILLVINRCCLFLDTLFFPQFQQQKITNPVFIIAAPRSATTYLFHLLAADTAHFTAFRLWEIIFAPSIVQKYIFIGFFKFDKLAGCPFKKITLFIEKKIFGDFTRIHQIGLNLPEEDEAILLWNMSTIYLNFFFPDTNHFADYFAFDTTMPERKKKKIMQFYTECVLRHNYVFNRDGSKRFLSKNPAMMAKVESLHPFYPDATVLNINRCPASTIPSTIALNNNIYRFFTSRKSSKDMDNKTKDILVEWYKMAEINLESYFPQHTIKICFKKLILGDEATRKMICDRLGLDNNIFMEADNSGLKKLDHKSSNTYAKLNEIELAEVLKKIPFMSAYCTSVNN